MNRGASPGRASASSSIFFQDRWSSVNSTEADVERSLLRSWEAISNLKAP